MPKVAIWPELSDQVKQLAESVCPKGYQITWLPRDLTEAEFRTLIGEFDYLVSFPLKKPEPATYEAFSRLKLWQLLSAGYDGLDTAELDRRRLTVCTVGGANAISVAEHTVMLMLAVLRRLTDADARTRSGEFPREVVGSYVMHELYRRTVGIVGFGAIGYEVAKRLAGFDCTLLYYDLRAADPAVEERLGLRRVSFEELLESSDVVSIHAPLTSATERMFDREAFGRMKPGSVLINAARGQLVDEPALIEAIESDKLWGAGLDVFCTEPPVPSDPLFGLGERVVVTPHIAGPTWESWQRRFTNAFANLERVERGEIPSSKISG